MAFSESDKNCSFDYSSIRNTSGYFLPLKSKKATLNRKTSQIMTNSNKESSRTYVARNSDWSAVAPNLLFNHHLHNSAVQAELKNEIGESSHGDGNFYGDGDTNFSMLSNIGALWNNFITDEMIEKIVMCTNNAGRKFDSDWLDTDSDELKRFFGVWYFAGINGMHNLPVDSLYTDCNNQFSCGLPEKVQTIFDKHRFSQLLRFMSFEISEENESLADSVISVVPLFDQFVNRCKLSYVIGANVYIDESVANMENSSESLIKISHKLDKCGIRIWCLNDCRNFYLYNASIDTDTEQFNPLKIVHELTENCRNSGRTVICDTNLTSVELADNLYTDQTFLVGKISPTCPDLPPDFVQESNLMAENECRFLFNSYHTLLKWRQPKTDKPNYYLSTLHHSCEILNNASDEGSDLGAKKPLVACYYFDNAPKFEAFDRLIDQYSCFPASSRPNVRLFAWILDSAAWNASRLYALSNPIGENPNDFRRTCIAEIAWQLMENRLPKITFNFPTVPKKDSDEMDMFETGSETPNNESNVDNHFQLPSTPMGFQSEEQESFEGENKATEPSINHFEQYLNSQLNSLKEHLTGAKKRKFRQNLEPSIKTPVKTKVSKKDPSTTQKKDSANTTNTSTKREPKPRIKPSPLNSNLPTMVKTNSVQDTIVAAMTPTPAARRPKKKTPKTPKNATPSTENSTSSVKRTPRTTHMTPKTTPSTSVRRPPTGVRQRCLLCPRKDDKKTRYHCSLCDLACCAKHILFIGERWIGSCCYKDPNLNTNMDTINPDANLDSTSNENENEIKPTVENDNENKPSPEN